MRPNNGGDDVETKEFGSGITFLIDSGNGNDKREGGFKMGNDGAELDKELGNLFNKFNIWSNDGVGGFSGTFNVGIEFGFNNCKQEDSCVFDVVGEDCKILHKIFVRAGLLVVGVFGFSDGTDDLFDNTLDILESKSGLLELEDGIGFVLIRVDGVVVVEVGWLFGKNVGESGGKVCEANNKCLIKWSIKGALYPDGGLPVDSGNDTGKRGGVEKTEVIFWGEIEAFDGIVNTFDEQELEPDDFKHAEFMVFGFWIGLGIDVISEHIFDKIGAFWTEEIAGAWEHNNLSKRCITAVVLWLDNFDIGVDLDAGIGTIVEKFSEKRSALGTVTVPGTDVGTPSGMDVDTPSGTDVGSPSGIDVGTPSGTDVGIPSGSVGLIDDGKPDESLGDELEGVELEPSAVPQG